MAKAGRPPIIIDWDQAERLVRVGLKERDVAYCLKVTPEHLVKRIKKQFKQNFLDWAEERRAPLRAGLLRNMWDMALNEKNEKMMLHLATYYLGHNDYQLLASVENTQPEKYDAPESLVPRHLRKND